MLNEQLLSYVKTDSEINFNNFYDIREHLELQFSNVMLKSDVYHWHWK